MEFDYLSVIETEAGRLVSVAEGSDPAVPIPDCPGWTMLELVRHVARVHRWAGTAARLRQAPEQIEPIPEDWNEALAVLRAGVPVLLDSLRNLDPDEPCWNFTPVAQVGGFWRRRQAHETAVHRWDAERAAGQARPLAAPFAADGIDEIVFAMVPRWLGRDGRTPEQIDVGGPIGLRCTDDPATWTLLTAGGRYEGTTGLDRPAVEVSGPAERVLSLLWNRTTPTDPELSIAGDAGILTRWLGIATG